jgi:sigma-B regulation protein RsbU (phosphoserine phosphatase)
MANSGLPYPIRVTGNHRGSEAATLGIIELPGVPLGAFPGSSYDEVTFELSAGDVYVFCTDGVFEAHDPLDREFGAERLLQVVEQTRQLSAREIVEGIFAAVQEFRGDTIPNDDTTAVAVKMTG